MDNERNEIYEREYHIPVNCTGTMVVNAVDLPTAADIAVEYIRLELGEHIPCRIVGGAVRPYNKMVNTYILRIAIQDDFYIWDETEDKAWEYAEVILNRVFDNVELIRL